MSDIIWVIGMVKNEADIIGFNLDHLFAQGISGATFLDNVSSDNTNQILLDHGAEVIEDPVVAYKQSEKMTDLAHVVAKKHKVDWIIPVDADEIWYSPFGTLRDVLIGAKENILVANVFNHFATGLDGDDVNPFLKMKWKWSTPFGPKVAIRYDRSLVIGFGNHSASRIDGSINNSLLEIRHFPYRSYEQLKFKVLQGATALKACGVKTGWTDYYDYFVSGGDEALMDIWSHFFFPDPIERPDETAHGAHSFHDGSLIYDPVPMN